MGYDAAMSALAGLWRFDGRPDAEADCSRMLASQQIYGPHHTAKAGELGGALAMGRNLFRLSPPDAHDRQPLIGERWTLVADVRLDDRGALAAALDVAPPRWAAMSDADLVLAALERWGADAVQRLYGDFAFAAFERDRRRLILARDPMGLRPLFHHRGRNVFAFATMPKGLHALAEIPRAPDLDYMARAMVVLASEGPATFFAEIARVEPGAMVVVTQDGVIARRWWNPRRETLRLRGQDDYVDAYRAELDAAVGARVRGEREVAAHLSSGFDSAAVAATAARLLAPGGGRVIAYTAAPRAGYDLAAPAGRIADESPLAARVAALHPNMEHAVVRAGGGSPLAGLDRSFFLLDWPTANPANAVWWAAIEAAARARGLKALLTGQQGNVTISYAGLQRLPELLKRGRLTELGREWLALRRNAGQRFRASAALTFGPFAPGWLWNRAMRLARGRAPSPLRYAALRPEVFARIEAEARAAHPDLDRRPWKDGFEARLWMLRRADGGPYAKATLAGSGLDQRDPTADRRLVEFCLSLPMEQFLRGGVTRALPKAALADRLPRELLDGPRRGLQAADWHEGVAGDLAGLAEEIERIAASPAAAIVDVERLRAIARSWPTDGWDRPHVSTTYRIALLRGVSAGHFLRKAAGGNA